MAFNSSLFLLYFLPVFLLVYFIIPSSLKKGFLLLCSVLFYAWGAPRFLVLLFASLAIDFLILRKIHANDSRLRPYLFWLSVAINIGLLLYFKYNGFFVNQVNRIFAIGGLAMNWTQVILPVGISFITFQKLAYVFEVYRRRFDGFTRFTDYALYIFMFPQLLAGPIVRPQQLAGQITGRLVSSTIDQKLTGFYRFVIGLTKKVLIADFLRITVDAIFSLHAAQLDTPTAWMGAVSYSFQIYFDFSGYSDMAIGLALMAGFKLPENFNSPYLSQSVTEFWRRWHITLSQWFRDYVFLPLAYSLSRKLPQEQYAGIKTEKVMYLTATTVTFLLCGLWHGEGWTFLAWGTFHGIFLICDRFFLLRYLKKIGKPAAILVTFIILTAGWVFFKSSSVKYAFAFLGKMFFFSNGINDIWFHPKFWTIFVLAAILSFSSANSRIRQLVERVYHAPSGRILIVVTVLSILLLIACEASITASKFSPFIYFGF